LRFLLVIISTHEESRESMALPIKRAI